MFSEIVFSSKSFGISKLIKVKRSTSKHSCSVENLLQGELTNHFEDSIYRVLELCSNATVSKEKRQ
jgi:hypothetical protein